MGLDCYIVHGNDRDKPFTHEDDERLKDVRLCGGLFSGSGSDGSVRGKGYEALIQELSNGDHTWYIEQDEDNYIPTDTLEQQADLLSGFIVDITDEYHLKDTDIVHTSRDGEEYTLKEVQDLETLLRVAAERKAVMTVWW